MKNFKTVAALRTFRQEITSKGETLALVPTMGALHKGHLSLVELAKTKADHVVVSIFVNPTQFGPNEDFDSYPRMVEEDSLKLKPLNIAGVFAPSVSEMYPNGYASTVSVSGLTDCLCGAARPGHFDGVATVVSKLLLQSRADYAVFGEKDWQQLQVIRRVNADLNIDCDIIGAPIYRDEKSGLALSSRNAYLSTKELASAETLNVTLRSFAKDIRDGADIDIATADATQKIINAGFNNIDYLECRESESLKRVDQFDPKHPCRVFVAAKIGSARLIDNMAV